MLRRKKPKETEPVKNKPETVMSEERPSIFFRGLTWRSLLALGYIVFVFQPGLAYLHLMTGSVPISAAIQWATILLFIEVCSLSGKPLTTQEAIIIYLASGQTLKYWWFLAPTTGNLTHPGWIYQLYFRHSTIAESFGIAQLIPAFYSPHSLEPWVLRTFFHPEWTPILLNTVVFYVAAMFGDICLTIIAYILYVRVENLPFPTAPPIVDATETLIQRDWKRLGFLAATSSFAAVYALALYVMPLISRVLWGASMVFIPVPWLDLNQFVQRVLPGGSFGIATDLAVFGLGFIIPFKVSLGMLIGSLGVYLFGNYILVSSRITDFWLEYRFGMAIDLAWQRSVLHAWAMPTVGMGIAIGVMPLLLHPNLLTRTFRALKRLKAESPLGVSIWWFLLPFLAATIGISFFDHWLAPDISIVPLILLNVAWPFASMIIASRAQGLGVGINVPYVREMTLRATGYSGINAWFVPIYTSWTGVESYKICDLTKTKITDFILAQYLIFPIGLAFGFFFMQSLWSLAPIPSSIYPGVLYTWPVQATFQALFISPEAQKYFVVPRIFYGFAAGAVLYAIGDRFGFASTVIGITGGVSSAVPGAVSTFIGATIGMVVARKMGADWWARYRGIIYAGILLGEGLIVIAGSAIAIIAKSMWAWPY